MKKSLLVVSCIFAVALTWAGVASSQAQVTQTFDANRDTGVGSRWDGNFPADLTDSERFANRGNFKFTRIGAGTSGPNKLIVDWDKDAIRSYLTSHGVSLDSKQDLIDSGVTVTLGLTVAWGETNQLESIYTLDLIHNWVEGDETGTPAFNLASFGWTPDSDGVKQAPTDFGYATGSGWAATWEYAQTYMATAPSTATDHQAWLDNVKAQSVPWQWYDPVTHAVVTGADSSDYLGDYDVSPTYDGPGVKNSGDLDFGNAGDGDLITVQLDDNMMWDMLTNNLNRGLAFAESPDNTAGDLGGVYMREEERNTGDNVAPYLQITIPGAAAPLTGDLNGDGFIGIDDLNIVLSAWGQAVSTPGDWKEGDPSGDGFVKIDDLNDVLSHWGQGTPPAASDHVSSVPEPASLALLGLGGLALLKRRRSGQRGG